MSKVAIGEQGFIRHPLLGQRLALAPVPSAYLNAVRGGAALVVLFEHWREMFFIDQGHVEASHLTFFVKVLYALSGFGHQAVMVFFVLSGFFISSSILRNLGAGTWSWRDYGIDRAVRLYVVLIPALLLGLFWDTLGLRLFNSGGIYSGVLHPFGHLIPRETLNWTSFLGNAFFLQTRFTPSFGSNVPLWSLSIEFWYYLLFPALVCLILAARRRATAAALCHLILAAAALWVLADWALGFLVWLSGCAIALSPRRQSPSSGVRVVVYCLCTGALFGICLLRARSGGSWLGSDLAVGLSFASVLHGLLQLQLPIGELGMNIAKAMAGFSYSLYVLHFPLLLFVRASWLGGSHWQPDGVHLACGFVIGVVIILYAYAISYLTERNTAAVRNWVHERALAAAGGSRRPHAIPSETRLPKYEV
jgi:peptidoglycan/LPS O-acetylase OafA/YrhL